MNYIINHKDETYTNCMFDIYENSKLMKLLTKKKYSIKSIKRYKKYTFDNIDWIGSYNLGNNVQVCINELDNDYSFLLRKIGSNKYEHCDAIKVINDILRKCTWINELKDYEDVFNAIFLPYIIYREREDGPTVELDKSYIDFKMPLEDVIKTDGVKVYSRNWDIINNENAFPYDNHTSYLAKRSLVNIHLNPKLDSLLISGYPKTNSTTTVKHSFFKNSEFELIPNTLYIRAAIAYSNDYEAPVKDARLGRWNLYLIAKYIHTNGSYETSVAAVVQRVGFQTSVMVPHIFLNSIGIECTQKGCYKLVFKFKRYRRMYGEPYLPLDCAMPYADMCVPIMLYDLKFNHNTDTYMYRLPNNIIQWNTTECEQLTKCINDCIVDFEFANINYAAGPSSII